MLRKEKPVIFLDIGGVLLPEDNKQRFIRNRRECQKQIAAKFADERYLCLNPYDLAAVVFDWDIGSIRNLKLLLERCQANIVISSSWRKHHSIEALKLFFHIYSLEEPITDMIPVLASGDKEEEINAYRKAHPELTDYIIIDDLNMGLPLRERLVWTGENGYFDKQCREQAVDLLLNTCGL